MIYNFFSFSCCKKSPTRFITLLRLAHWTKGKPMQSKRVNVRNVLTCVKSFSNRGYKPLCLSFSHDNNNNNYDLTEAEEPKYPFSRWMSKWPPEKRNGSRPKATSALFFCFSHPSHHLFSSSLPPGVCAAQRRTFSASFMTNGIQRTLPPHLYIFMALLSRCPLSPLFFGTFAQILTKTNVEKYSFHFLFQNQRTQRVLSPLHEAQKCPSSLRDTHLCISFSSNGTKKELDNTNCLQQRQWKRRAEQRKQV